MDISAPFHANGVDRLPVRRRGGDIIPFRRNVGQASDSEETLEQQLGRKLISRRHSEWTEFQRQWRWLADTLEGGTRYKHNDYTLDPTALDPARLPFFFFGYDPTTSEPVTISYGQIVNRNLVPHVSETSKDGRDVYLQRLNRTPVPTTLARVVNVHLAKLNSREIRREGPEILKGWWADVDGSGVDIQDWIRQTVAPLFLALGQIDLVFDHPPAEEDLPVETRADERDQRLDTCVASVILPENVVWWKLNNRKQYKEVIVFERDEQDHPFFVHYTTDRIDVYDPRGNRIEEQCREHPYGINPVRRIFDRRKPRCRNVGQPRFEAVAELQKAIYNALSELILGDVQQSHAQLSGPVQYCQSDSTVPVGPGNILPKYYDQARGAFEGWEYIEPPKGAQAEVRQHVLDFQDAADTEAALSKPAGVTGNKAGPVAQSGISKVMDSQTVNAMLAEEAAALEHLERQAAEMALTVLGNGKVRPEDEEAIDIAYPRQFDLFSLEDLSNYLKDLQLVTEMAGQLPENEIETIHRLMALALPGLADDRQEELREEIASVVRGKAAVRAMQAPQAVAPQYIESPEGTVVRRGEEPTSVDEEMASEFGAPINPALASGMGSPVLIGQSPI